MAILTRLSLLLLVVGLCGVAFVTYRSETFDGVALRAPVQLRKGQILSAEFKLNYTTSYDIRLDLERTTDFDKLNCWLGERSEKKSCAGMESKIALSWQLFSEGHILDDGQTQKDEGPTYWGSTIGRKIGEFQGGEKGQYRLVIVSNENFEEISIANPKIVVEVNASYVKQFLGDNSVLLLTALGGIALAVLLAVPALVRWLKRSLPKKA